MLKIIQLGANRSNRDFLIEAISNATNRQTKVDEADRRSNSKVFSDIQNKIFTTYGFFFEKKKGEFYSGLHEGLLAGAQVIERFNFLKAYLAYKGDPQSCRSKGERTLFRHDFFKNVFPDASVFVEAFFAYKVFIRVTQIEKSVKRERYGAKKYGNGLRYGRFAIVAAVGRITPKLNGKEDFDVIAETNVTAVLEKWKKFEQSAKKKVANKDYFIDGEEGFDNYYKGKTLDRLHFSGPVHELVLGHG